MEMKKGIYWIISAALVIAILYVLLFMPAKGERRYSGNPEDWVENQEELMAVDVEEATEGKAFIEDDAQQYRDGELSTVFAYELVVDGEFRDNPYRDEQNNTILEVTDKLNPADGVIQILMLEKIGDDSASVYIFVDEDWKKEFGGKTRVVWGSEFQNQKAFTFSRIAEGVYFDKVIDDPARFPQGYGNLAFGGVAVGPMTKQDIQAGRIEGMTAVFLR